MQYALVVVRSFGAFGRGDTITDATKMHDVLTTENATKVVRVALPASKQEG